MALLKEILTEASAKKGTPVYGLTVYNDDNSSDIDSLELFSTKEKRVARLIEIAIEEIQFNADDNIIDKEIEKVKKMTNEKSVLTMIEKYSSFGGDYQLHTLYMK